MDGDAHTRAADPAYIESLYQTYQSDSSQLDEGWRQFFAAYEFFLKQQDSGSPATQEGQNKALAVHDLIQAYRSRGHLLSTTNPVRKRKDRKPRLALTDFGFGEADLDVVFPVGDLHIGKKTSSLKAILTTLQKVYTGNIGFEYMHISNPRVLDWFKQKCEQAYPNFALSVPEKTRVLEKLNEAVVFENFLHTKYVGQKRFSLEGGETTIPALDAAITTGAEQGISSILIGMAHRGRLNVLSNVLGKTYEQIFHEFEGNSYPEQTMGDGDVKYHMGYSSLIETPTGKTIKLELAPNPSHLEAVGAVVQGLSRARIDQEYGNARTMLPILIHGDAAVAGQGLVYEIAQMSKLDAYTTGGTLHFVINNQIGFTTDFEHARSSIYCTDVAKIIDAPILHVNGDDPEAVVFCMQLAIAFRQTFQQDVFVDMLCYRKHGHNESDEPKFTQPALYKLISTHPNPREVYTQTLTAGKQIDVELAKNMDQAFRKLLQARLNLVKQTPNPAYTPSPMEAAWDTFRRSKPADFDKSPKTAISQQQINRVAEALLTTPADFTPIRQIKKMLQQRRKMFLEEKTLNWANAELLAYGSLLLEGKVVRVTGQDTQRGTFSHRHAVLKDAETSEAYSSLAPLAQASNHLFVYNTLLSEYGAMGFEFGYSLANPHALVVWEAQFGDFANGAQVVIDQFLATSYTKWQRMSGLVLLLPHGYEGQGPEHSSARLERFLQLSSGNNMFVCNVTQPANFFHMLRRQLALPFRMPCVLMSPKSLFRHPQAVSPVEEFTQGSFKPLIDDNEVAPDDVRKLLFCTGKVYYDLLAARTAADRKDIAILRFEQIHPCPQKSLLATLKRYKHLKTYHWVQEEPENMGAWGYLLRALPDLNLQLISRKVSASPATGYHKLHTEEQANIMQQAME